MNKPLIAVDCDHVLADINEGMRCYANEAYGEKHTPEDYNVVGPYRHYWERVWGLPDGEKSNRFNEFVEAGCMEKLEQVSGAMSTINSLKDSYRFALVTARRSDREIAATYEWLSEHADGLFEQVIFMDHWAKDDDNTDITKGSICSDIGAEYLIDDNYDHCFGAYQKQVTPLLFGDYGWNREVSLPEGMIRAKDWRFVEEYFGGR